MAGTIKLNDKEQIELRNKAKTELLRLEKLIHDKETKEIIDKFKDTFSICEIVYKVILEDHQYHKTGKHLERMQLTMRQVPYALSFAGYNFDKDLLTKLFGSETRIGKRSVKVIRDLLTHSLTSSAINELIDREAELYGYMDSFLEKIRNYDS